MLLLMSLVLFILVLLLMLLMHLSLSHSLSYIFRILLLPLWPCLGELELFQKLLFAEAPPAGRNSCFPDKLVVLFGVACRVQLLRVGANAEGRCTPPAWRGGAAEPSGRTEGRSTVGPR